jgi:Tfp pilus assembly protein PilN
MIFKTIKKYFIFSREQRSGVVLLFGIIIVLQMIYFFVDFSSVSKTSPEKERWLSLQSQIDSMKKENAEVGSWIGSYYSRYYFTYKN